MAARIRATAMLTLSGWMASRGRRNTSSYGKYGVRDVGLYPAAHRQIENGLGQSAGAEHGGDDHIRVEHDLDHCPVSWSRPRRSRRAAAISASISSVVRRSSPFSSASL